MPWLEAAAPVRMERIVLVAPDESLRDVLVQVADSGSVEIDQLARGADFAGLSARLLRAAGRQYQTPALSAAAPDPAELDRAGRYDLLAGEAQLEAHAAAAVQRSGTAGLAGWGPAGKPPRVGGAGAPPGGAARPVPHPPRRPLPPPTRPPACRRRAA